MNEPKRMCLRVYETPLISVHKNPVNLLRNYLWAKSLEKGLAKGWAKGWAKGLYGMQKGILFCM